MEVDPAKVAEKKRLWWQSDVAAELVSLEYGDKRYNFYSCQNCRTAYYGGRLDTISCNLDPTQEVFRHECGDDDLGLTDPQYLCGGCQGCSEHGSDFMGNAFTSHSSCDVSA